MVFLPGNCCYSVMNAEIREEHFGIMWNKKQSYKCKLLPYKHGLLFTERKMYKILKDKVEQFRVFSIFFLLTLKISSFAFHMISKMKLKQQYVQAGNV